MHNTPKTGMLIFQIRQANVQMLIIRTVREILPELVTQIMSLLSSEEAEQQEVRRSIDIFITRDRS